MRSLIQELRELADELREAELKCGPGAAKFEQLKAAMKAKDYLLARLAQSVQPKAEVLTKAGDAWAFSRVFLRLDSAVATQIRSAV